MSTNFFDGYKRARFLCLVLGICGGLFNPVYTQKPELKTIFQWSQLDFEYESAAERQADIDSNIFIPGIPTPIDVDVYYSHGTNESRIFVTIPRFQPGSPITLGTVSDKIENGSPLITPYPSWEWHRDPEKCNENRLITVYRVHIDECGRMWVLDTGRYNDKIICSPQILAFDLKTGKLVDRYEIPSSQVESRSILTTIIADVRDSCENTFVYNGDCQTYSIIVYDSKRKTSWLITDRTMYPYPRFGIISIKGDSFQLMDGILGMALTPYIPGKERKLFYHALSSPSENWVETSYLRNQTIFEGNPYAAPEIFHTYRWERNTQSAAEAIDSRGILYYGSISDITLRCFNTKGEYGDFKSTDIVASNPVTLQFPTGVKIIKDRKGVEELWILTDRLQKVSTGTLNTSEVNFRILAAKASDLVFGTRCVKRKPQ